MRHTALASVFLLFASSPVLSGEVRVDYRQVVETKAIFGRLEARTVAAARARIGGTLVQLSVTEGDMVRQGDIIAVVTDDKIALQIRAAEARLAALVSEQSNARVELGRATDLFARAVGTRQRVDQLKTQVEVLGGQIEAAQAERAVILQQASDGQVSAPVGGRVIKVPVSRASVIMPGEAIAQIAGDGFFLRLALPERYAAALKQGGAVKVDGVAGRLAKIYPLIENGHVLADVEIADQAPFYIGERRMVQVPVGERKALFVPKAALFTRSGLDLVRIKEGNSLRDIAVVTGEATENDIEILSGLNAGDVVVTP